MLAAIRLYVPIAKKRTRRGVQIPWWNKGLKQEVKRKHNAWKDYVRTRGVDEYRAYAHQRNITTLRMRRAKRDFESRLVNKAKTEPQNLYRYIRSRLKVKTMVGPLKNASGQLTESDGETAEVLNSFFKSVFVEEGTTNLPPFTTSKQDFTTLSDICITEEEVLHELNMLKDSKATGPDEIPSIVLKSCAEVLARPLTVLFRKSLDTGKVPEEWKQAIIIPLFKKGSKVQPGNYRPVSLTSQCCKILERIIRKHVVIHLENNNIISVHQHGFVKKRSCQTNLLEYLEDLTKMIDEGTGVDVVYLDYQKAFDTVPHE